MIITKSDIPDQCSVQSPLQILFDWFSTHQSTIIYTSIYQHWGFVFPLHRPIYLWLPFIRLQKKMRSDSQSNNNPDWIVLGLKSRFTWLHTFSGPVINSSAAASRSSSVVAPAVVMVGGFSSGQYILSSANCTSRAALLSSSFVFLTIKERVNIK